MPGDYNTGQQRRQAPKSGRRNTNLRPLPGYGIVTPDKAPLPPCQGTVGYGGFLLDFTHPGFMLKMRIALDARIAHYTGAGIGQYAVHLAQALARLDTTNQYVLLQSRKDLRPLVDDPRVQRTPVLTPSHHRWEQQLLAAEFKVRPALRRPAIDLLHSTDFIPPLRVHSFKSVITVHDLAFLRWPHFLTEDSARYYGQVDAAVERTDHIIAVSESTKSDLVKLLQTAGTDAHRTKAEAALLALCSRVRDKCVPALTTGLAGADARTRATLLQALARAGGPAALEAVASCLEDPEPTVRDEAVRMLSLWPDRAVAPRLEKIAAAESLRHHVLAIRGLVRLASPEGDQPADLKLLGGAIRLAKRRDEKQLALGVLSRAANAESLAVAVSLLDDPAIAEDAGWTAGVIAESLPAEKQEAVRAAMRQVLDRAQSPKTREQAQKVLKSL